MIKILGYGEDTLTLWTLKNRTSEVLRLLNDKSNPLSTLLFFRPSFGRHGGMKRAEFGEFDAIFASSKNVYLIESKWDNLSRFKNDKIALRQEQIIRHEIFSWYLTNWVKDKYFNWTEFHDALKIDFKLDFRRYINKSII